MYHCITLHYTWQVAHWRTSITWPSRSSAACVKCLLAGKMTVLACGCREETCQITTGTSPRHNSSRSDLETHHSHHNKTHNNNPMVLSLPINGFYLISDQFYSRNVKMSHIQSSVKNCLLSLFVSVTIIPFTELTILNFHTFTKYYKLTNFLPKTFQSATYHHHNEELYLILLVLEDHWNSHTFAEDMML